MKDKGYLATGTVRIARLPGCNMLLSDRELEKRGRESFDVRTES